VVNIIADNTVRGPYFWTGRGFGVNLALEDGFGKPTPMSGRCAARITAT